MFKNVSKCVNGMILSSTVIVIINSSLKNLNSSTFKFPSDVNLFSDDRFRIGNNCTLGKQQHNG